MTCKHGSTWCPGFDQWHSQLPRPCSGCVTEAQSELVRLRGEVESRIDQCADAAALMLGLREELLGTPVAFNIHDFITLTKVDDLPR
jgi:hypothetical protein